MFKDSPSYQIVKSAKEIGFLFPEDRKWIQVDIPINNSNFIKYNCECISRNKLNRKDNDILEVILKPFCYSERKKKIIYYLGQCLRCETVYWTTD